MKTPVTNKTITVTDRELITIIDALMFYAARAQNNPHEVQAASLIAQMTGSALPYARPDEISSVAMKLAKP